MNNLDRLKGSGLLIQGFDEFLVQWLGEASSTTSTGIFNLGEAGEIFEYLPSDLQCFYQLVNRWRFPNIRFKSKNQSHLVYPDYSGVFTLLWPPRYQKKWTGDDYTQTVFKKWQPDVDFLHLSLGDYDRWKVVLGLNGDCKGQLFSNKEKDSWDSFDERLPIDQWFPFPISLEEFLVSMGFRGLFDLSNELIVEGDPDKFADAGIMFEANIPDNGNETLKIYYHTDHLLWYCNGYSSPVCIAMSPR